MRQVNNNVAVKYKNISIENVKNEEVYCITTEKNHIIYGGRNGKFNWIGQCDNYHLENSHVFPAMIRKFHEAKVRGDKEIKLWGTGSPYREFLHVDDLADACLFLMENYNQNEIINIGSGKDLTIKDLALLMKNIIGFEGEIYFDSSKPDGTPKKLLDVSKLHSLGWNHTIELEQGIKETYQDYLTTLD